MPPTGAVVVHGDGFDERRCGAVRCPRAVAYLCFQSVLGERAGPVRGGRALAEMGDEPIQNTAGPRAQPGEGSVAGCQGPEEVWEGRFGFYVKVKKMMYTSSASSFCQML